MQLQQIHHIAIIVSDYAAAKEFYIKKLGFSVIRELSPRTGRLEIGSALGRRSRFHRIGNFRTTKCSTPSYSP